MSVSPRLQYQIGRYGLYIALALGLLGVFAIGLAANTYLNPPVEEFPPEETDIQEFQSSVDTKATVIQSSSLYEEGETLENAPVYLFHLTPEVELIVNSNVPPDDEVTVEHELRLSHEAAFEEAPFWEEQQVLLEESQTTTDGTATSRMSLNVSEVVVELGQIDADRRGVGSVATDLVLETSYESSMYQVALSESTTFHTDGQAYWFDSHSVSDTQSQVIEREPQEQSPSLQSVGLFLLLGLGLVVAGVVVGVWQHRHADVSRLEQQVHHRKYSEWISEGTFPTEISDKHIYVSSLEDLVDIGIDTGKRVIYDPDIEAYGVVDGDILYYHATEPTTIQNWLEFREE